MLPLTFTAYTESAETETAGDTGLQASLRGIKGKQTR